MLEVVPVGQEMREDPAQLLGVVDHLVILDGDPPPNARPLPAQGHEGVSRLKVGRLPVAPVPQHELMVRRAHGPRSVIQDHLHELRVGLRLPHVQDRRDADATVALNGVAIVTLPLIPLLDQLQKRHLPAIHEDNLGVAGKAAAGRVPLHDEQLAMRRVFLGAVGQLAGEGAPVERALAADQLLGFARRLSSSGRVDRFTDHPAGNGGIFLEVRAEGLVDGRLDDPLDLAVPQLGFGLAFELRVPQLDADDRGQALADIVAGQRFGVLLQQVVGVGVGIDGPGQRRLEADQMGAALARVDVVGKGEQVFRVPVVVLQRHFQHHVALFDFDEDGLMQRRLGLVQVLDERHDPALVAEDLFSLSALVLERDRQAFVEEGEFAQALGQHVEAELERLEDLAVRLEGDLGPALLRFPGHFEGSGGLPALIPLLEHLAVLPDLHLQPLGEGVHDRDPHPMEAARYLIGPLLELPAGVQHGQGHFRRGLFLDRVHPGRDAAPVIDHRDAAVDVDRDLDRLAEPRHVFVDAVVHRLIDQVVQPVGAGAPDVHRRALADRVQPLQHLDLIRTVPLGLGPSGRLRAEAFAAVVFDRHPATP